MKLTDRTIIITGGTSGIGLALVKQLAPLNQHIIVLARDQDKARSLESQFSNVTTMTCDLAHKLQVLQCVEEILSSFPDACVLINNAAVQYTPQLLDSDFSFDSIELEIKTNFMAPIWLASCFLEHFKRQNQGAAIINVTSGLAIHPKSSSAVYCATKAGLRSFTRSLGYQLESSKVQTYEMLLPLVDTSMTLGRGRAKLSPTDAAEKIIKAVNSQSFEAYIGKAALIPWLNRLSPSLMAKILKSA